MQFYFDLVFSAYALLGAGVQSTRIRGRTVFLKPSQGDKGKFHSREARFVETEQSSLTEQSG